MFFSIQARVLLSWTVSLSLSLCWFHPSVSHVSEDPPFSLFLVVIMDPCFIFRNNVGPFPLCFKPLLFRCVCVCTCLMPLDRAFICLSSFSITCPAFTLAVDCKALWESVCVYVGQCLELWPVTPDSDWTCPPTGHVLRLKGFGWRNKLSQQLCRISRKAFLFCIF